MSTVDDDVDVPDRWEDWPFEARAYVLAEANSAVELRESINSIVGMPNDEFESDNALSLTKSEAAQILMALGGPNGSEETDV